MTPVALIGATLPVPLLPLPATGPTARERRGTIAPTAIRPTPEATFRYTRTRPEGSRANTEGSRSAQGRKNVGRQDDGSDDPLSEFRAALSATAASPILAQIFSQQPDGESAPIDSLPPAAIEAGIAAYRSAQSALAGEPDLQQEIDGLLLAGDHPAIDLTV